ncbi:hypothetical protein D3C81_1627980 [compost metagenome]
MLGVQRTKFLQESLECLLFGQSMLLINIGGIGSVESDPEEDEAPVNVLCLFRTIEPAQGSVNP